MEPTPDFDALAASARTSGSWRKPIRLRHGHVSLLGRDVSTPLVLLGVAEFVVLVAAFHLALGLGIPGTTPVVDLAHGDSVLLTFALVNMAAMLSMGLYRKGAHGGFVGMLPRLAGGLALGAGALAIWFYLFPEAALGPREFAVAFALAFAGLLITRVAGVRVLQMDAFRRRVLVLGAGRNAGLVNQILRRSSRPGFEVIGFVPGNGEPVSAPQPAVLIPEMPLVQFAQLHRIDDVVVALDDARGGIPFDDLIACKMAGVDVLDISDFFEREAGAVKLDTLRPSSLIFARGFRKSLYRDVTKRVLDVLTSTALLAFAWPLMLLVAAGVFIESRGQGSVLYRQVRVGQHGRHFTLLKFRSMVMNAESDGVARWALEDDERITAFGRFIRKTRLDELPQLLNVLRGDMSFVGPRPERPVFVSQLAPRIPFYQHRHWVKPGVTGWAQINYPYGASEADAFEKLQYDLYYVKNPSISLDLLTILQTVEVVLFGRGAR